MSLKTKPALFWPLVITMSRRQHTFLWIQRWYPEKRAINRVMQIPPTASEIFCHCRTSSCKVFQVSSVSKNTSRAIKKALTCYFLGNLHPVLQPELSFWEQITGRNLRQDCLPLCVAETRSTPHRVLHMP